MKITRKGYYEVFAPDGSFVSRHTSRDESYEAITEHGIDGVYTIVCPEREVRVVGSVASSAGGDTQAPTIPTSLAASAVSKNRVDLSWSASTDNVGVVGYQVFRDGVALDTVASPSTSYSDTTVLPSTLYTYAVAAFDAAGNTSAQSAAESATTPSNSPPSWETVPDQDVLVGNSYNLNLGDYTNDADTDPLTYSITTGSLPTGLSLSNGIITGTPTTAGESSTVTFRADDGNDTADVNVAFASFTSDVTAPPVPTGLAESNKGSGFIALTWNASVDAAGTANEFVSGVTSYKVYRDGALRTTTAQTSFSDTGLSADTAYSYTVLAVDAAGNESSQSSAVVITTNAVQSFSPADLSTIWSWTWAGENGENVTTVSDNFGPKISLAQDLSGNGRNYFNNNVQQGGSAEPNRPGYQVGCAVGSWTTALPTMAVQFFQSQYTGGNGNNVYGQILYQSDSLNATGDFYVAAVIGNSREEGNRYLFGNDSSNAVRLDQASARVHIIIAGTDIQLTASGAMPTDTPQLIEIWRSGSNLTCFINGEDVTLGSPTNSGNFDMSGIGGFMSGSGPANSAWDDFAFEYVVCDGLPTALERSELRSYLNDRWDLYDPLTLPLLQASNFSYVGAFRLPDDDALAFSSNSAIAFNPVAGTLFIVGRGEDNPFGSSDLPVAEFSIPTPVNSSTYGNLNTATRLQNYVSVTGGNQSLITLGQQSTTASGMLVYDGKLYVSMGSRYLNGGDQNACLFVHDNLNLSIANVTGPFEVSNIPERVVGSGMGELVPAEFRSAFGNKKAFVGGGTGLNIVGNNQSNGPTVLTANPEDMGATPAPVTVGTYYPNANDIGSFDGPFSTVYTGMSVHRGTWMVEGYRTVVCFGRHGDSDYIEGGQKAPTRVTDRFWLMDSVDVKNGVDGAVATNSILPYATVDFDSDIEAGIPQSEDAAFRGATYDPDSGRVYVVKGKRDNSNPIILVWQVG